MQITFDLERYLDNSRKVETSDLDFGLAKEYGLTADEIRCLTYMMDIESHTLIYLKGLLSTCAIRDPEVVAFLNCWAYEEFFHGRAIRQFLQATGIQFDSARVDVIRRERSWQERIEEFGSSIVCRILSDFQAVYLAWGAIQELTTLEAYGILARRTENPVLKELLLRIVKDERRHFSFYFNKARPHLRSRASQLLTGAILRRFWTPVGNGIKADEDVRWTTSFLFSGSDGMEAAGRIDDAISRLPGLDWFNLFSQFSKQQRLSLQES
jgi:rubrerythrin